MAPDKQCPYCRLFFKPGGAQKHIRWCEKEFNTAVKERQFTANLLAEAQRTLYISAMGTHVTIVGLASRPAPRFIAPWQRDARAGQSSTDNFDPTGFDR